MELKPKQEAIEQQYEMIEGTSSDEGNEMLVDNGEYISDNTDNNEYDDEYDDEPGDAKVSIFIPI